MWIVGNLGEVKQELWVAQADDSPGRVNTH